MVKSKWLRLLYLWINIKTQAVVGLTIELRYLRCDWGKCFLCSVPLFLLYLAIILASSCRLFNFWLSISCFRSYCFESFDIFLSYIITVKNVRKICTASWSPSWWFGWGCWDCFLHLLWSTLDWLQPEYV